jgi:hypothetical protein
VRFDGVLDLRGDVRLTPAATIDKAGYPSSIYFYSIAFDASGALWASAFGDFLASVVKYAGPGMLAGTSSPSPDATIVAGEWLPAGGLAFDNDGRLWLATSDAILQYSDPGALSGEVAARPSATLPVVNEAVPALNAHLLLARPRAGAPAR